MSETDTARPSARAAALAMDPEEFRRLGYRLVDRIAGHLRTLPQRPVTRGETPDQIRTLIDAQRPLPERGEPAETVLEDAAGKLIEHSLFNGHPRFWGYITSSPAPIGMLGDLLAAAVNPNVGAWTLAPVATEIEAQTVRWIGELIGFPGASPGACGGLLVSGGNMANLVCFLAARAAQAGWAIRESGLAGGSRRMLVYASEATHTWIQKAADLFGHGTEAIRWIPTNAGEQIDLDALGRQVGVDREAGHLPFLVVGTAGSVSTGAVDPLAEMAAYCRAENLWFHVDGAYGAMAAGVAGAPGELAGLSEADSVAVDPHKWLYAPLEAGCALVRDPRHLRDAFSYHPPYYHFEQEAINYFDLGPQNSRGFRALKVWLALRQAGREGYREMIATDIRLARRLAASIRGERRLEALTQALSINTFRFVPDDLRARTGEAAVEQYLNRMNQQIQARIEREGEAFLSNAVIAGRYALRACIVNFRTGERDVDALPELVIRIGSEVDREMRAQLP